LLYLDKSISWAYSDNISCVGFVTGKGDFNLVVSKFNLKMNSTLRQLLCGDNLMVWRDSGVYGWRWWPVRDQRKGR
jgi:hypothetical protein